jgi:hypothetical protein
LIPAQSERTSSLRSRSPLPKNLRLRSRARAQSALTAKYGGHSFTQKLTDYEKKYVFYKIGWENCFIFFFLVVKIYSRI